MPFPAPPVREPRAARPPLMTLAVIMVLCAVTLSGCAIRDGRVQARAIAAQGGFIPLTLDAGDFVLRGWLRPGSGDILHVYIEGDGSAWKTRAVPSTDPTPRRPTAFRMASADPTRQPVLYLGRPCQYTEGAERRGCERTVWTSARYSARVVRSLELAIAQVARRAGTTKTALYGFSGGGALAALLAERGDRPVFLGTAAANLDTTAWTAHHGVTPLAASLNPSDSRRTTAGVRQVHLSGEQDTICPPFLARTWCEGLPDCEHVVVSGMGHGDAWEDAWPREICPRRDGQ